MSRGEEGKKKGRRRGSGAETWEIEGADALDGRMRLWGEKERVSKEEGFEAAAEKSASKEREGGEADAEHASKQAGNEAGRQAGKRTLTSRRQYLSPTGLD